LIWREFLSIGRFRPIDKRAEAISTSARPRSVSALVLWVMARPHVAHDLLLVQAFADAAQTHNLDIRSVRCADRNIEWGLCRKALAPAFGDTNHDVFLAVRQWVEHGIAPTRIIGTKYVGDNPSNGVSFTRPMCAYPQLARYRGIGDTVSRIGS
jgi:Tannase and feruloyl esterase